jgi:hypothetical protein
MGVLKEKSRTIPVAVEADVAVCGGGPAGVAAALGAARSGARTTLVEQHGCLGGIWTAGAMCWIADYQNKTGIMAEIMQGIADIGGRTVQPGRPSYSYDVEKMKLLLDRLCLDAGVDVHLHTRVVAAHVTAEDRLTHVITESKSGRRAVAARRFIDCTGDGDVGALAGCGFDMGHPETGRTQPMSLMALITGLDPAQVTDYYRSRDDSPWKEPKQHLKAAMERGGHSPSYAEPTLIHIRDDLFALMANHQYGVKGTNEADLTRATMEARQEVHALVDGLRSLGGEWARISIVATGAQIGVREGRRIHGRQTVTLDDMLTGRRHEDAVCTVTFPVDVHSLDPERAKGIEGERQKTKPYDIPQSALIARDVDGLLMAGRCISGDFLAHSSYRVTGNAVAMGEAAGRMAASESTTTKE